MTYKVLFLDIDGTILKRDHTYTDLTKNAIDLAKAQGIEVFLATGRPLHEIQGLAKELSIDSFIGYNGAYAIFNNEVIVNETMESATVLQLLELTNKHGHEMILYTNGKNYFTDPNDPHVQQFMEIFQMTQNERFKKEAAGDVLGMTVMKLNSGQPALYEIEPTIRLSQVNITGAEHAYDILRSDVNKGEAVKKVLGLLNLTPEQAIAFGDGMNDKEMFQTVGTSFAMENANPELFQYATHRTTSVDHSGVYEGLRKLGVI